MRKIIASKEKNIKIPNSSKCFSYVVVNDSLCYKENGLKSTRKDDYIEYLKIAKESNIEIDIGYYLEQIVEIYAYFINEDNRY